VHLGEVGPSYLFQKHLILVPNLERGEPQTLVSANGKEAREKDVTSGEQDGAQAWRTRSV
jgi:hypothetical protein